MLEIHVQFTRNFLAEYLVTWVLLQVGAVYVIYRIGKVMGRKS
jgi:hypothetical protein